MSKIAKELEFVRAGFDQALLKSALDTAIDFELIRFEERKAFITEEAKENLWRKNFQNNN